MEFKTWEDANKFLLEYGRCSCLNCNYGGANDLSTSMIFCTFHIAMVRLAFSRCCKNWVSTDKSKTLKDFSECTMWKLNDETLELLESDKKWSFDEIVEVINEHEEVIC